jgi:hypothetical protein
LLPAQTIICRTFGVTPARTDSPNEAAIGKKRPPTTWAVITRLAEGQLAPHALQQGRLRRTSHTRLAAVRTLGKRLLHRPIAPPDQFVLAKLSGDFVADLTGQLFQIDERARLGQLLLMFSGQLLDHSLDLLI